MPARLQGSEGATHALEFSAHGFGLVLLPRSASGVSRTGVVFNLKTAVDAILGPSSSCYDCTNDCSAMHPIGEIPNNCNSLWIQLGAELAGVQLLFLGSNISLTASSGSRPKSSCGRTRDTELSRASSVISLPCCSHAKQIFSIPPLWNTRQPDFTDLQLHPLYSNSRISQDLPDMPLPTFAINMNDLMNGGAYLGVGRGWQM